jgi:AraC-like DNA-binding protein
MLPPFAVRTAGHVFDQPGHSTPGTRQADVMLTVFLAGEGRYWLGGASLKVEPGMVGLVPPSRPGILLADPDRPYDHYYCRFGGAYARRLAAEARAAHGGRFFRHERHGEVADLLRRMGVIHRAELPRRMGEAELLLAGALVLLAGAPAGGDPRALAAAGLEHYCREHVSEPFDLARVAEHFGVSKTSLCRAARRLAGRTVLDMAEGAKIEWARTLLASGAANVAETARRTGYADPFYFSRVFRKLTGMSPREWARRRRSARGLP